MAMNNPHMKYQEQAVLTAPPEELTLMLYDGCIKFLSRAEIGLEDSNIEMTNTNIIKAQSIISELNVSLDMDYEVSKGLRPLYNYLHTRLVDANIKKDKDAVAEVKSFVVEMRDTWKEAIRIARTSSR